MEKLFLSIKKGVCCAFKFSGRSNQFEFTTYVIFTMVVYYGGTSLLFFYFADFYKIVFFPWAILAILLTCSHFANGARRLEDAGNSKFLLLLVFIPIVGIIFILYLMIASSVPYSTNSKKTDEIIKSDS